jgi:hypothetical protein
MARGVKISHSFVSYQMLSRTLAMLQFKSYQMAKLGLFFMTLA